MSLSRLSRKYRLPHQMSRVSRLPSHLRNFLFSKKVSDRNEYITNEADDYRKKKKDELNENKTNHNALLLRYNFLYKLHEKLEQLKTNIKNNTCIIDDTLTDKLVELIKLSYINLDSKLETENFIPERYYEYINVLKGNILIETELINASYNEILPILSNNVAFEIQYNNFYSIGSNLVEIINIIDKICKQNGGIKTKRVHKKRKQTKKKRGSRKKNKTT